MSNDLLSLLSSLPFTNSSSSWLFNSSCLSKILFISQSLNKLFLDFKEDKKKEGALSSITKPILNFLLMIRRHAIINHQYNTHYIDKEHWSLAEKKKDKNLDFINKTWSTILKVDAYKL